MGSPAFGLLPGNNATPPPVFAGNNPTGGAFNMGGSSGPNSNFPNFPMFGMPSSGGAVSPMANAPVFSMGGMQGLNSGFGSNLPKNVLGEFQRAYGKGTGSILDNIFQNGLFNPQVASAFLNAMQPGVNRGEASLLNSFGAEGSRFGSAAALGEGDYLSQVNLNEQSTLAQMFMQAQQEQLGLLENTLPTLHAEEANQGGFWSDLLGGVGSFFGGSLLGDIFKGFSGGGNKNNSNPLMSMMSPNNNSTSNIAPFLGSTASSPVSNTSFWDTYSQDQLTASAGNALFGA